MKCMRKQLKVFSFLAIGLLPVGAKNQEPHSTAASTNGAHTNACCGKMPTGFDPEVARVVREIDDIEKKALNQIKTTTRDRQGGSAHSGNYSCSIKTIVAFLKTLTSGYQKHSATR